jgi:molybdopterin-guanine dinucleotide biosynthesis protein A
MGKAEAKVRRGVFPGTAGAILVGGRSRRMGEPKTSLVLPNGEPMGERMVRLVSLVCGETLLVGGADGLTPALAELPRIDDRRPGLGPVQGIAALLASERADVYLVTGCDQPLLLPSLLASLLAASGTGAAVFRLPGRTDPEPLPVAIPASARREAIRAVDEGRLALGELVRRIHPRVLDVPQERLFCFRNVNTRADARDPKLADLLFPVAGAPLS